MTEIPAEIVERTSAHRPRRTLDRVAMARGAIALAVIVVLTGCGGSSSSSSKSHTAASSPPATATVSTTPAATPAHEKFVARLDEICARGNAIAAPYSTAAGNAASAGKYSAAATALEQSKRHTSQLARELDNLKPPASDQAAFARYQTARHQIDNLTDQVIVALRARNTTEVRRLLALNDSTRQQRTAAAAALGSKRCGK